MSEPTRPKLEPLDEATQAWVTRCIEAMKTYLRDADEPGADDPTPALLDTAWIHLRRELKTAGADEAAIKNAINIVGFAFGETLVRGLHMEWAVATDNVGKDIVVHSASGWVVHPRDVVRKRYANDEGAFLSALYDTLDARSSS